MTIHMVTQVDGQDFKLILSRDDAGNYVAEAARMLQGGNLAVTEAPCVRVVDSAKERALNALFDSIHRVASSRRSAPPPEGPDTPAAA